MWGKGTDPRGYDLITLFNYLIAIRFFRIK